MLARDHRETGNGQTAGLWTDAPRIVAVQGASSETIQSLLIALAQRWAAEGLRLAGVVEETRRGIHKSDGGTILRNLRTGAPYDIYQDLGAESTACCLDARGFAEACQHVIDDLAACDVVILSKFGKLESERGGLLSAFATAALAEKPVVTAVSPAFSAWFLDFVGPYGAIVPPDETSLRAWASTALAASP